MADHGGVRRRGPRAAGGRRVRPVGTWAGLIVLVLSGAVSAGVGATAPAAAAPAPAVPGPSAPAPSTGPTHTSVHLDPAQATSMRTRLRAMLPGKVLPGARRLVDTSDVGANSIFPPLSLTNISVIDLFGNLTTYTQPVTSATTNTVGAGGHPTSVTVASAGFTLTVGTVNPQGLVPGTYFSFDGNSVSDTVCGASGALESIFEVDQAMYNGANQPTAFAVQYESICQNFDVAYGTFAFMMLNNTANQGYYLFNQFGGLVGFGNNNYLLYLGSPGTLLILNVPVIDMITTPDGSGYWMLGLDGGIFAYGSADFHGSMGGQPLNAPIVGMAPSGDGQGYWLVGSDGGIFAFGDATFHGSMGGRALNAPIVAMAYDPNGNGGYWLVASDGGLFGFGKVGYFGSTGNIPLVAPIVGMATTTNGLGYWFVASDGGVFAFGNAGFHGSTGAMTLAAPMIGILPSADDQGYWLVASDGGIFTYGDAVFHGSLGVGGVPGTVSGIAA